MGNNTRQFTAEELEVIDLTVQLWNKYRKLPEHHPDEVSEMRLYIHQIQALMACRACYPQIKLTNKQYEQGNKISRY